MSGKTNRTKGHALERSVAKDFREKLAYKFAKTTRLASRLLDNCQVDISGIPFLIQTKAGYAKSRPKADVIFNEIEKRLLENYPEEDPIHKLPKVLVHKIDGRNKYNNLVTMPYEDFISVLSQVRGIDNNSPDLHLK